MDKLNKETDGIIIAFLTLNTIPLSPCFLQLLFICLYVFLKGCDSLLYEVEEGNVAVDATLKGKNSTTGTPTAGQLLFLSFLDLVVVEVFGMNGQHVAVHDTKEGREGSVRNIPGPARSTGRTAKPYSLLGRILSDMCNEDECDAYEWL
jgi:hypothetical protein